jgi:hypothetical protein
MLAQAGLPLKQTSGEVSLPKAAASYQTSRASTVKSAIMAGRRRGDDVREANWKKRAKLGTKMGNVHETRFWRTNYAKKMNNCWRYILRPRGVKWRLKKP